MQAKALPQPAAWFSLPTLSLAGIALVALGVCLALREARLASPDKPHSRYAAAFLLGVFYFFLVLGWSGWLR